MIITELRQLYKEDLKLIEIIRSIGYGEITIKIRQGCPVVVESGIKTIKLEEKKD